MSELLRIYAPAELGNDGYPFEWHRTIKHLVRKEAGNRCLRCGHPYQKGLGEWSPCDQGCDHGGPIRVICDNGPDLEPDVADNPLAWLGGVHIERVEARWRVLTVHHLDGVKENCNWWNLVPLCQRDHLVVQRRVVMKRAWPWEHSAWFRPYAAALAPGLEVSPTSLSVQTVTGLSYKQFESALNGVLGMGDSVRWWVGDLLIYARAEFGEDYAQALQGMRLSEHQLNKYRWVAERVDKIRRRENLSFSHHEVVAAADPNMQERLLAMAESAPLSVAALKEAYNDQKAIQAPPPAQIVMKADTTAVDAARGLRAARDTLRDLGEGSSVEAADALNIGGTIRGLDAAAKIVRRNDPLEEVLDAVGKVIEMAVVQSGLADPAAIVPSGAWANLVAAHHRATERRGK